jgi:hypothetical protein
MDSVYRTMAVLIEHPSFAILPAASFVALFYASRRPPVLLAAAAWVVYVPYEYAMKFRILCSGECNIRIDLLVLYPVLLFLSGVGVVAFVGAMLERRSTELRDMPNKALAADAQEDARR